MKKMILTAFAALFMGCEILTPDPVYPVSDSKTSAVLVIIEDSYIGRNFGAMADLQMVSNMVATVTDDIVVLRNGMATKRNVKNAIMRACSNEVAIVFFTCHGGHEKASGEGLEEKDGYDEYVYLSDTSISDNELYDVFKTSTNRVFAIFNCCNSGTMFAASEKPTSAFFILGSQPYPNLLSWGACEDGCGAVSTRAGGEFVLSMNRAFEAFGGDITYGQMWTVISCSSDLRKYQKPVRNCLGDSQKFENVKFLH